VRIWICGVRGSTPAPGSEFVRYGGHTSCLAVAHDGERPTLILDAGTGIRRVSDLFGGYPGLLGGAPFEGAIVLGHLHWDHVQGLPFFGGGNHPNSRVDLYLPAEGDPEATLGRAMSPPHFPIAPSGLLGSWKFIDLEEGQWEIGGFTLAALEIPHSRGRTFGYRVSDGRTSFAYLSDHCPTKVGPGRDGLGECHDAAMVLARGCDTLFHDGQNTDEELAARAYLGHASTGYAVGLARAAGVGRLFLTHHDPTRTDDQIDTIVAAYRDIDVSVRAAREDEIVDVV
jgi:phosphoribosyl 1,2-cyclic phosphodiesterase